MLEKYPKEVKLVFVNFPLSMHPFARKAAVAAMAAAKQGKFREMHDRLFARQNELSDAMIDATAKELGLDMDAFGRDLRDPAIAALIDRDIESGRKADVQGTPTVLVNGHALRERSMTGFSQAIEGALGKAHNEKGP